MSTIDHKGLRFGVEIECGGPPRNILATALADALCAEHNRRHPARDVPRSSWVIGGYSGTVTGPDGRVWKLVNDGSIGVVGARHTSLYGSGTEVVTPILCGDDDVTTLQCVVRALKAAGAHTDESCGVHVHVDGAGFRERPIAIKWLARTWSRYEDLVGLAVDLLPRRRANYCRPVDPEFMARLDALPRGFSLDDVNRAWYGRLETHPEHYHGSRYRALNLHSMWDGKGTVEFRLFNGTLHAGKVRAYVQLCRCVVAHALNATSARAERRDFDPSWTRYALWGMLKNLGMVGDEFATAREHLIKLGKGAAGFRTAAAYHAWQVRHGRIPGEGPNAAQPVVAGPASDAPSSLADVSADMLADDPWAGYRAEPREACADPRAMGPVHFSDDEHARTVHVVACPGDGSGIDCPACRTIVETRSLGVDVDRTLTAGFVAASRAVDAGRAAATAFTSTDGSIGERVAAGEAAAAQARADGLRNGTLRSVVAAQTADDPLASLLAPGDHDDAAA